MKHAINILMATGVIILTSPFSFASAPAPHCCASAAAHPYAVTFSSGYDLSSDAYKTRAATIVARLADLADDKKEEQEAHQAMSDEEKLCNLQDIVDECDQRAEMFKSEGANCNVIIRNLAQYYAADSPEKKKQLRLELATLPRQEQVNFELTILRYHKPKLLEHKELGHNQIHAKIIFHSASSH